MADKDEWSEWIEHDGNGCPCKGKYVQAVNVNGFFNEGIAGLGASRGWYWDVPHPKISVIRFRIRKPRGLTILETIAREVERERVDA